MTRAALAGGTFGTAIVVLALVACDQPADRAIEVTTATPPAIAATHERLVSQDGLLYGRITTEDGAVHEGRLRWGRGREEEALWSNYFNGVKTRNPWVSLAPRKQLPKERISIIRVFGKEILGWDHVM